MWKFQVEEAYASPCVPITTRVLVHASHGLAVSVVPVPSRPFSF